MHFTVVSFFGKWGKLKKEVKVKSNFLEQVHAV